MEVEYDKNGITLVEGEQHGRLLQYMQLGLPPWPLPLAGPPMRKATGPSVVPLSPCPAQLGAQISGCAADVLSMRILYRYVTCISRAGRNLGWLIVYVNLAETWFPDICSNTSGDVAVKIFFFR